LPNGKRNAPFRLARRRVRRRSLRALPLRCVANSPAFEQTLQTPWGPLRNKLVKRGRRGARLARRAVRGILIVSRRGATQPGEMRRRPQRPSCS
jgi:hypothetical protein